MVYSVPVNTASEVPVLAAAGAGELYCSLQEPWWTERYGEHDSISRRQGRANFASREELAATVTAAQAHSLPLFLALNGQYDEHQLDYLTDLADAFERMGGAGLIVRDLGLLYRLEERGSRLRRACSLLAVCANAPSVEAYASLGVTRIVFPRFMAAEEIGEVLRACARKGVRVEAESMVFFDKCPLVDGYCTHYHGVSYPERTGADAELVGEPLYAFDTAYRTHACLGRSCDYLEPYPCAACELDRLRAVGVGFGKLGGRGRPLEERVRALAFLKTAEGLPGKEERKHLYQQTFGQPCACYYGARTQSPTAIETMSSLGQEGRVYVGDAYDGARLRATIREIPHVAQKPSYLTARGLPRGLVDESAEPYGRDALTVLVGPLSQFELDPQRWGETLRLLCQSLAALRPTNVHLCANDVGTLTTLARSLEHIEELLGTAWHGKLRATAGPLLTRGDMPAEFEHFISPDENPPRPVWDLDGMPRLLVHSDIVGKRVTAEGLASERPPYLLWDHWVRQMAYGRRTSYRLALSRLAGIPVSAEF